MKWTRLTIRTVTGAEDLIISEMYELGLMGAQIEDNVPLTAWEKEQMFVDILPDTAMDDGRALLHFFVEVAGKDADDAATGAPSDDEKSAYKGSGLSFGEDNSYSYVSGDNVVTDLDGLIAAMKEKLEEIRSYMDIGEGTIEVSETEDKDWANNWKEFFKPFSIDDLRIVPSWIDEPGTGNVLRIDPGSAFGTGMHETTRLCIRSVRKYISHRAKVLDVGTGSGILGIVALIFGAGAVVGTDLDICAREAVAQNLEMNGFKQEDLKLIIGNVITDDAVGVSIRKLFSDSIKEQAQGKEPGDESGLCDMVCANILAEVLVSLTPKVPSFLKEGGIYITSGILEGKEDMVKKACEDAGLKVVECLADGEWRCVVAKKETV